MWSVHVNITVFVLRHVHLILSQRNVYKKFCDEWMVYKIYCGNYFQLSILLHLVAHFDFESGCEILNDILCHLYYNAIEIEII